ncbi:type VII secretion system-associated protein [Streptomyces sp. GC420]|uniref:type VII secretion system-associated protein n=1 Tax=Streptomyces sp. GC420 TaxID=2697568 RepID=UPI0014150CFF|nr:type VII secretion system-associated protein [Streptomyces sp. GC420]NBM15786.1 type VII secretion system-associated protein [Streptomyces sp. GC420]
MADSAPVNLDKAWLENFLNTDVRLFLGEIKKIMADGTVGGEVIPTLYNLLPAGEHGAGVLPGAALPLTIGGMLKDGETNGANLDKAITELITAVHTVYKDQKLLFESIEDGLEETLEKLFKTQGENLEKIDGEKLLDIFSDVDQNLAGSGGDDD